MVAPTTLRLATRGSAQATAQARSAADALMTAYPGIKVELVFVETLGDRRTDVPLHTIGGQGVFVKEVQRAVLAGDGQVTFGQTVMKQGAKKIRRLYNDRILAGFAGSAADSFALFSKFEAKLEQYPGQLTRAAVELAKDWRTDRILRRLEAMLIVLDASSMFLLSGNGDLIEPDDGIVAIGSGGPYALAAAKALAANTNLPAREIAVKSMTIAGENSVTISNLLVGEVWICSGQSNMEWPLAAVANSKEAIATANDAPK